MNGDLRITPLCSANRSFQALLPAAALARLTGPMEVCRRTGALLKIPALLNARTRVIGGPCYRLTTPRVRASSTTFSLTQLAMAGSRSPLDDAYYLVWQSGIHLTRAEHVDHTVFELSTHLTSPDAELIREADTGGVSEGVFPVPLRLTVTRLK